MNRNIVATLLIIAALILLTAETDKHEPEKPKAKSKITKVDWRGA